MIEIILDIYIIEIRLILYNNFYYFIFFVGVYCNLPLLLLPRAKMAERVGIMCPEKGKLYHNRFPEGLGLESFKQY